LSRFPSANRSLRLAALTAAPLAAIAAIAAIGASLGFSAAATPPSNTTKPSISGTLHAGATLTADPGTWAGDAPISFAYTWQHCDSSGGACADARNGSSQTYILGTGAVGQTFRVVVKATNPAGVATATSATTAPIAAAPVGVPAATAPPSVTGSTVTGSTLTAAPGTWTGTQPLSYAYAWQRCDANGGACQPIANATQATYVLAATDAGATLRVVVTASNAAGSSASTSVPTAKVTAGQSGIITLPGGLKSVPVETLALPDRLLIDRVSFAPAVLSSRAPFTMTVRVRDTRGYVVRGAKVFILGVPYSRVAAVDQQATATDGTVTFHVTPLSGLELGRGKYLVFFVRAVAPQDKLLAGVSTRRLVQLRTGPSA
jgi:hypothetical protein